jgi:hypothetical protein
LSAAGVFVMAEVTVSEGSRTKAKAPTWTEWLAMEKQLESMFDRMGELDLGAVKLFAKGYCSAFRCYLTNSV